MRLRSNLTRSLKIEVSADFCLKLFDIAFVLFKLGNGVVCGGQLFLKCRKGFLGFSDIGCVDIEDYSIHLMCRANEVYFGFYFRFSVQSAIRSSSFAVARHSTVSDAP